MVDNIVTASVSPAGRVKTRPLYQYDYGQILKITGIDLPAAYEVHFANSEYGASTTQIGNADGVAIPDAYLLSGADVFAWLYLHSGTDDGETVYKILIPVCKRAAITPEQPTPVQQDAITQAIAALDAAVAQTAQDVEDAEAASETAQSAAASAHLSDLSAQQSATEAAGSASEAAQSAQTATTKATEAATSATAAQTAQSAAASSAQTAQVAEQRIENLTVSSETLPAGSQATVEKTESADGVNLNFGIPEGADGYSPAASVTKSGNIVTITITDESGTTTQQVMDGEAAVEAAEASAAQAASSAQTATQQAGAATTSATAAQTAQGAAAASAQTAQTAATAASTKAGEASASATTAATKAAEAAQSAQDAQGSANSAAAAQSAAETAADEVESSIEDAQVIVEAAETLMIFPATGSGSASVATVTDASNDQPMALKIGIEPVQAGSGTPAPDNVRAISGCTGAGITCSGKNLLNPDMNAYSIKRYYRIMFGVVPWNEPAIMSLVEKDPNVDISGVSIGFVEDVYKDSSAMSPINFRWVITYGVVKDNKTNIAQTDNQTICTGIFIYPNTSDAFARLFARFDIQVEIGSVATAYEPYRNQNVYQVAFPAEAGTVYGGTLDIAQDGTGTLTVDRAMADLGTLDYQYVTDGAYFFTSSLYGQKQPGALNIMASAYSVVNVTPASLPDGTMRGNSEAGGVYFKNTAYTDAASFKSAMSGQQLVYELATPQTYTFTAEQIKSLLGITNVWSDCGDTQITAYFVDKTLLITKAEQRIENLTVSSETLPAGSPASVEKQESADGVNLHFGIPKGADGQSGGVTDVQVNGASVVTGGVANVPIASSSDLGVVKVGNGLTTYNDALRINPSVDNDIKIASEQFKPITPLKQHRAVFYGFAKAAGDTTQSASSNAVGTYTENAKSKISEMLSSPVSVTGTTPTITALSGIQYVCGEVATLDITLPASGIVDVVFESGSTPTVLTITPPTGMTVEWANGFDPTTLDADTLYELNIKMVGSKCLGVAGAWS